MVTRDLCLTILLDRECLGVVSVVKRLVLCVCVCVWGGGPDNHTAV